MRNGVDTDFLVALEIEDHPHYDAACQLLEDLVAARQTLAIAPQVLAEFVHIVTDRKRFPVPLPMTLALERALFWWEADEVEQIFPTVRSVLLAFNWMHVHSLGRKRTLDTQLAATLYRNEVTTLITNNHRDFRVFGCFDLVEYKETTD